MGNKPSVAAFRLPSWLWYNALFLEVRGSHAVLDCEISEIPKRDADAYRFPAFKDGRQPGLCRRDDDGRTSQRVFPGGTGTEEIIKSLVEIEEELEAIRDLTGAMRLESRLGVRSKSAGMNSTAKFANVPNGAANESVSPICSKPPAEPDSCRRVPMP